MPLGSSIVPMFKPLVLLLILGLAAFASELHPRNIQPDGDKENGRSC